MDGSQSSTTAIRARSRLAEPADTDFIVDLSSRVQAALTAAGSLQEIGPLQKDVVTRAMWNQSCYVLENAFGEIVGCALSRPIEDDFFPPLSRPDVAQLDRPFHYLHSLMLDPKVQGFGMGAPFTKQILSMMQWRGGTVLLDCWAGSDKLRAFYLVIGFRFVAIMPKIGFEVALFAKAASEIG